MQTFRRLVICAVFIAVSAFAIVGIPLSASAHSLSVSSATHVQDPHPFCNGSVSVTPDYQSIKVHSNVYLNVTWSCEGGFYVTVDVNWGDGGTSSYTCWANCTSGSQPMQHVYSRTGTYHPDIIMGGNASGSASVTVYVHS